MKQRIRRFRMVALVAALAVAIFAATTPGAAQAPPHQPPGGQNDGTAIDVAQASSDGTLSLDAGGQFVFWTFAPANAADVFASVKIAWLFDPTAIAWISFVPLLGVTNFSIAEGAVLWVVSEEAQEIPIGGPALPDLPEPPELPAGGLTPAEADQIVIDEVVQPATEDQRLLLFRHPDLLREGDRVLPGIRFLPDGSVADLGGLTAAAISYFYWIDDAPGARFAHDTRFVLVDAVSGDVTTADEQWWPELNGVDLFTDEDEYRDPANWVHALPDVETLAAELPPVEAVDTAAAGLHASQASGPTIPPAVGDGECLLIINGWLDGEIGRNDFVRDAFDWRVFGLRQGYERIETMGEGVNPDVNGVGALIQRLRLLADDPNCRDITIYITTHGGDEWADGSAAVYVTLGGTVLTADRLAAEIRRLPTKTFKVIIDACFSGNFLGALNAVSNVQIVITSSNTRESYFDIDPAVDPNPSDAGGEFTSGFLSGLDDLMGSARARAAMRAWAEEFDLPFAVILYYFAYENALLLDAAFLSGDTMPVRSFSLLFENEAGNFNPIPYPDTSPLPPRVGSTDFTDDNVLVLTGEAMAGAMVFINGEPAPVVFLSDTGIGVQIAEGIPDGEHVVSVETDEGTATILIVTRMGRVEEVSLIGPGFTAEMFVVYQEESNPHGCCIDASNHPATIDVDVTGGPAAAAAEVAVAQDGGLVVTFTGANPWVTVSGPLQADGAFSAEGRGFAAGFANILVTFEGTLTPTGVSGTYTIGADGGLPGGRATVFLVEGGTAP